jgi:transposase-like protein
MGIDMETLAGFGPAVMMANDNDLIRSPPIPADIIRHATWLCLRFTFSVRDVEDLLAERGLDVSYETVRRWVLKFGPLFAKELRHRRHGPTRIGISTRWRS